MSKVFGTDERRYCNRSAKQLKRNESISNLNRWRELMKGLTEKQLYTYNYIKSYVKENFCSPTYQEIGDHFGITQNAAVNRLDAIEAKGFISRRVNRQWIKLTHLMIEFSEKQK